MRAAVTRGRGVMEIADVPDPGEPGEGEVVVRPEAVGLCGSDFHYFLGHIGSVEESKLYPRIFGHEAAGILDAVGPGCPPELRAGERVAMWPLVVVRALLPVPDREAERVRRTSASSACTRTARSRTGCAFRPPGLPGRRPRSRRWQHSSSRSRSPSAPRPRAGSQRGRRSSCSARARSVRPSPSPRSTEAHRCCSSTASQSRLERGQATGADLLVLEPVTMPSPPRGSGRAATARRSSSRRRACPRWHRSASISSRRPGES